MWLVGRWPLLERKLALGQAAASSAGCGHGTSFFFGLSWAAVCACTLSHFIVSDSVTPWTIALQAPLSMGFSR